MSIVEYAAQDGIATIDLNRPEAGNGYTVELSEALVAAFDTADADPDVKVVILSGRGKNFCVGADLSGGGFGSVGGEALPDDWTEPAGVVALRIFAMDKPVIAALHGAAVGGGTTITLPCDYRLAAPGTRLGFVFSQRGIYPEGCSAWFLPRLVGLGTAFDWMISGRLIDAEEAQSRGLIHGVHDDVEAAARELAERLVRTTAPVSTATIRRLLYFGAGVARPSDVQPIDSALIASIFDSPDAYEGVASFFERREPDFPGRVPDDLPAGIPWPPS